jgi:hypothetical protein
MAMTLQQAIDYAIAPTDPTPFGLETYSVISLHDDEGAGTLMSGVAGFPNFTFRPDLPLLNWGPTTISRGGLVGGGWFAPTQVPGFSTRGQGGTTLTRGSAAGLRSRSICPCGGIRVDRIGAFWAWVPAFR